jgi:hypothetical protein
MAYNAARNAASIPKGRAVHTVYVRDGQVIGDSWQHASVHGAGRSNASVDEAARREAVELRVDITERIAIDRLRVLIDALESLVPASDAAMFRNALAVAQRNPGAPDTALTAVAAQIDAILRSADSGDESLLVSSSLALMQWMQSLRQQIAIDAPSAAALVLAARIPAQCAYDPSNPSAMRSTLATLLREAGTQLCTGNYLELSGLVILTAMRGQLNQLDTLSDQLLATAERLRDEALNAPPDPLVFSKLLYRIPPYAVASLLICRWVTDFGLDRLGGLDGDALRQAVQEIARGQRRAPRGDPAGHGAPASASPWQNRATQAEEIAVRAADGLAHQYSYWMSNELREIRDQVQAAIASGDYLTAEMLIGDGELANYWPKSYRAFFEGTGPEPGVDPNGVSNAVAPEGILQAQESTGILREMRLGE